MKLFEMRRPGFNGAVVAQGCVLDDGRAVLAWAGEHQSMAVYSSLRDLFMVHRHGHEGTWIVTPDRGQELSLDPWHADAFTGTPAEGVVGHTGTRALVWLVLDAYGEAIGVAERAER